MYNVKTAILEPKKSSDYVLRTRSTHSKILVTNSSTFRKIPIILIKHTRYFVNIFIVKSRYHHRNTIIKLYLYVIIGYNLQFDRCARAHTQETNASYRCTIQSSSASSSPFSISSPPLNIWPSSSPSLSSPATSAFSASALSICRASSASSVAVTTLGYIENNNIDCSRTISQ